MGEKTQTYLDNTGQNHYNYFAKMVFVCAPRNFAGAKERNDLNMANMKKEYKMSAERKEELQKELTYLKTVREKEVADTGIGISPEHLPHIFTCFYRADPSRNKEIAGNGLGLSVVKTAVEKMQGEITVVSEEGKGTCFHVTLPA